MTEAVASTGSRRAAVRSAASPGHDVHIDGIRGLAVLAVLLFHAFPAFVPGGFIGVDLFFVISGFVVTRLIAGQIANAQFSFVSFLCARFWRLVPASAFVVLVVLVAGAFVYMPDAFRALGFMSVSVGLLHANYHLYSVTDYFRAPVETLPLLHYWSLAVEVQFYIVWPALLAAVLRVFGKPAAIALTVALLAASLAYAVWQLRIDPVAAFYLPLSRAWEFLAGGLLGLLGVRRRWTASLGRVLAWSGIIILVGCSVLFDGASMVTPGVAALPVVLGGMAMIVSGLGGGAQGVLTARPLVALGRISYSLYLVHWPLLSMARYLNEAPLGLAWAAGLAVASVVLGAVLWWGVEERYRRPWRAWTRPVWRTCAASVLVAVLMVGAGLAIFHGKGWHWRLSERAQAALAPLNMTMPIRAWCNNADNALVNDARCNVGGRPVPAGGFDVLVYGDSIADHMMPAFHAFAEQAGVASRQLTQNSCPPLLGESGALGKCAVLQNAMVTALQRNPKLRMVILQGNWAAYHGGAKAVVAAAEQVGEGGGAVSQDAGAIFEGRVVETIRSLRARGLAVHILGDTPRFPVVPLRCIARVADGRRVDSARSSGRGACGVPIEVSRIGQGPMDALFKKLAAADPGVTVAFPSDVMCNSTMCFPVLDGTLLMRDHTHLNAKGAVVVGRSLVWPAMPARR